jgi:hypothetical protein
VKRVMLSMFLVLCGLLVMISPVLAGDGKVVVCHATSSDTNPYVRIEVSVNSIASAADWFNGHGGHPEDTWEGFTARNGDVIAPQGSTDICKDSPMEPTETPIPPTATPEDPPTATPEPPTETPIPPTNTPPVNPTPTSINPTPTVVGPTSTPVIPTRTPPGPHPTHQPVSHPTGAGGGSFLPIIGLALIGLGLLCFPWKKVLG